MSSKLIDRIVLLLKADAHGVVESIEERSLLLKQCVREAEIEVGRKRARLDALREEEKRLAEALARAGEAERALDEDVSLALSGGKEDLARFAVRRLIPRRREAAALRVRLEERGAESRALASRLTEQEEQLESLRVRVRGELARGVDDAPSPSWLTEGGVSDEEVELELLRRREREGARS